MSTAILKEVSISYYFNFIIKKSIEGEFFSIYYFLLKSELQNVTPKEKEIINTLEKEIDLFAIENGYFNWYDNECYKLTQKCIDYKLKLTTKQICSY